MPGPASSPFRPNTAGTITRAVTTSSAATALVGNGCDLMLYNAGADLVFYNLGDSTVTAAVATGTPIPAGAIVVIGRASNTTHIASIAPTSTATLYATTGEGS